MPCEARLGRDAALDLGIEAGDILHEPSDAVVELAAQEGGLAAARWFRREVRSATALVRPRTSSCSASTSHAAGGRVGGSITAAKTASTRASSLSVLATMPYALANMRTRNGSTTATRKPAA